MIIKYPVKYDDINLSVNDADGRVLAIIGWPKITKPMTEIHAIGRLVAESINSFNDEQERLRNPMMILDKNDLSISQDLREPERDSIRRGPGRPRKVA